MKTNIYSLFIIAFSALTISANSQCTITAGPTVTPNGLSISVTGTGTGATLAQYAYNWGDATTYGTSQTSTHTYAAAGNYNLCMYYVDLLSPTCLDSLCINITVSATGIVNQTAPVFNVQATPNPFSSEITINLSLDESQNVDMMVFDLTGKQIAILKNSFTGYGNSTIIWKPNGIAEGIYFLQVKTEKAVITKKIVYSGN